MRLGAEDPLFQRDERGDRLPLDLVRLADHRGLGHARVVDERTLHFHRAVDGAIVGLLAGLFGATCQFVLSIPIGLLVGPVERQLLERLRDMSGSGVAEFNLDRGPGLLGVVLLRLIAYVFTLVVGSIVSTMAGVVGAVLFAKPKS